MLKEIGRAQNCFLTSWPAVIQVYLAAIKLGDRAKVDLFKTFKQPSEKSVGAQFMPGLLDANLCKNKQTNNNITISLFKVLFIVCFCLFLHKLTSNKPGIY